MEVWESLRANLVELAGGFAPIVGLAFGLALCSRLLPMGARLIRRVVLPRIRFVGGSGGSGVPTARVRGGGSSGTGGGG